MNIGSFYNVTELGHGGMGTVYSGFYGGKKVAIKKFRRDFMSEVELINRFRLEAQTLQKLNHPSIVRIIEPTHNTHNRFYPAFEENGELYLAMEFIEGDTLDRYVRNNGGPLSEDRAVHIMCNILDAMEYVRQKGIIHRDIKPSNIIIRPDGASICIIDFGIVKDLNTGGLTTGRCVLGTDGYMSPEQANGLTVDSRTDIYSLGCLLFYMLTATHAIEKKASDYETRMAILRDDFPCAKDINPNISDRIQHIIDKAVNKNMLLRFQSPKEFKMELCVSNPTILDSVPKFDSDVVVSVGRDSNCDIQIYDPQERVSRHHLDIEYKLTTGGCGYLITDRSTNGTRVNETFIRGNSTFICTDAYTQDVYPPRIILAGAIELDWVQVTQKLKKDIVIPPPPSPEKPEKLTLVFGLLSFFFPIVGWVLYYQWKQTEPKKAKQASSLAWAGFAVNVILSIIINVS